MPIREVDKAYAAGLIDGEGSISARRCHRNRISFSITVVVAMCDPDAIVWLSSVFGGKTTLLQKRTNSGKSIFHWSLHCRKAAVFLEMILPYMQVKHRRASMAIQLSKLMRKRGWPDNLASFEPSEINGSLQLVASIKAENASSNGRFARALAAG